MLSRLDGYVVLPLTPSINENLEPSLDADGPDELIGLDDCKPISDAGSEA